MYSRNGGFVDRDQALSLLLPAAGAVEGVRSMARRALSLADQTRDAASRARSVSGVDWRSIAAESFRRDLASCAADVERCATALDEAAAALRRHADTAGDRAEALRAAVLAAGEVAELAGSVLRQLRSLDLPRLGR